MTDAISSVSTSTASTATTQSAKKEESTLSDATKKKLEALGIDPSSVTSESEAQQKIKEAQAAQAAQNAQPAADTSMKTVEDNAKSLASKLDISLEQDAKIDDIMDAISAKITEKKEEAGNDPVKKLVADNYQAEYDSLQIQKYQAESRV